MPENPNKETEKEDVKDEKKHVEVENLKNKANDLFKGMFIILSPQL